MKKFETPRMSVLTLEVEDVLRTSAESCIVEGVACTKCYCRAVTCDPPYVCDLVCRTLSDFD